MPTRIVAEFTDAQRQAMRKHNARYVYRFGDDGEEARESDNFLNNSNVKDASGVGQWTAYASKHLDKCSCIHLVTFFIVLIFVIVTGIWWDRYPLTRVDLTYSIYVFEGPGGAGVQAVDALANYVKGDFCSLDDDGEARFKPASLALYNRNALPVQLDPSTSLSVWGMLMAVLVITMLFEMYRAGEFLKEIISRDLSFLPEILKYDPKAGPDLSRWLEYALTSPWQVIIVAVSFHIREAPLLLMLGMLQALLVLMGYAIEREIDTWARHKIKSIPGSQNQDHNYSSTAGVVLFVFTGVAHAAIWWMIRTRLLVEQDAVAHCTANGQPEFAKEFKDFKHILNLIWGAQFGLFTVFGLGPPVTLLRAWKVEREEDLKKTWQTTSFFYSILSITAKVVLAGLLFAYAVQLKDLQNSQWVTPTPTPAPSGG